MQNKTSKIHVNPQFTENKSVIHINPNVHINTAIHVNPRMVKTFASAGVQQRILQSQQATNVDATSDVQNVQKSVYVNPRLMERLTNRVPDPRNTEKPTVQPVNSKSVFHVVRKTSESAICQKKSSPDLISLSRRKLVRIRPVADVKNLTISTKIQPKLCTNPATPKIGGKIVVKKIVSTSSLRKVNTASCLKVVNGINSLKKINNVASLKKVNNLGSLKRISSGSQLKKINVASQQRKIITALKINNNNNIPHQLKKINVASLKKVNTESAKKTVSPRASSKSVVSKGVGSKYKIDRTSAEKEKRKTRVARKTLGANKNLVNIDGVFYRSSKSCLVKSSNSNSSGTKSKTSSSAVKKSNLVSSKARKLRKHVIINGKIAKINPNTLTRTSLATSSQKSNYKHVISNRVKQRSLQILRHKMCKNNQPCLLFQRFGYCAKHIEGTCPKVHDKKQVALCKNFLQGKCLLDNCPLSHDVGPEKMPTCKFFLEGCCVRENCQYLHVKVSANTPICVPFLRGYCAKGDQCKERHTNVCPDYEKYGKCPKGKNCPYPHKSCILPQHSTLKLPTTKLNYKKSKNLVDISSHDDTKKRYYDDNDVNVDIEQKRCIIGRKIRIMTSVHRGEMSDVSHDEMKSQPESTRPRRPPIGELPSYIPID